MTKARTQLEDRTRAPREEVEVLEREQSALTASAALDQRFSIIKHHFNRPPAKVMI